jgi:hypothetical protein
MIVTLSHTSFYSKGYITSWLVSEMANNTARIDVSISLGVGFMFHCILNTMLLEK